MGFSCYSNAVNITVNNNLETVYAMLLLNSRYSSFSNNSFSYYALNDSSAKIQVFNSSIIVQSSNESTDWYSLLYGELYELWIYNATALSEEDVIFLAGKGCCGSYNNGVFVNNALVCSEEIVIPKKDDSGMLSIYVSIIPFLVILVYYARKDYRKYLAFLVGFLGWLIAFILRLPILANISVLKELWIVLLVPALMSGLFEEMIRYLALKYLSVAKKSFFLFAMGWSLCEVLIIFNFNLYSYLMLNQQLSFVSTLPGLVERLSATIVHLALTIMVIKSFKNKKFLVYAMLIHSGLNVIGSLMLLANFNIWLIEAMLLVLAAMIYYLADNVLKEGKIDESRRDIKKVKRKR